MKSYFTAIVLLSILAIFSNTLTSNATAIKMSKIEKRQNFNPSMNHGFPASPNSNFGSAHTNFPSINSPHSFAQGPSNPIIVPASPNAAPASGVWPSISNSPANAQSPNPGSAVGGKRSSGFANALSMVVSGAFGLFALFN